MTSPNQSTIGSRLRAARIAIKLSKLKMAKALGISRGSQTRYESGERSPTADYLEQAAKLGVDVSYVITGKQQPTIEPEVDLRKLLDQVIQKYGDDFRLSLVHKRECPCQTENGEECDPSNVLCRWELNHEPIELDDFHSLNRASFLDIKYFSNLIYYDPLATPRERELADMIEYADDKLCEANDEYDSLQTACVRQLCNFMNAVGYFPSSGNSTT